MEFFDINSAAVFPLSIVAFHKEVVTIVDLKAGQCVEGDITELWMLYEPAVFIFKEMFEIFNVSNDVLVRLDEFFVVFWVKAGKCKEKERLKAVEFIQWDVADIG